MVFCLTYRYICTDRGVCVSVCLLSTSSNRFQWHSYTAAYSNIFFCSTHCGLLTFGFPAAECAHIHPHIHTHLCKIFLLLLPQSHIFSYGFSMLLLMVCNIRQQEPKPAGNSYWTTKSDYAAHRHKFHLNKAR